MWALRKYLLTFIDSNIQRLHQVLIKSMCMNVNGPDQRMIFFHGFYIDLVNTILLRSSNRRLSWRNFLPGS